jgi:hypothetical protein
VPEITTHTGKWLTKERLAQLIEGAAPGNPMPVELKGSEATKDLFRQAVASWELLDQVRRLTAQNTKNDQRLIFAHQALKWGDALMGYDYGLAGKDMEGQDELECEEQFRQALRKYSEIEQGNGTGE